MVTSTGAQQRTQNAVVDQCSPEREQFQQLQQKYIETTQKQKQIQIQFQQKQTDRKHAMLTAQSLQTIDSQSKIYKPVGRGFVMREKRKIEEDLSEIVRKSEKQIDDFLAQKQFLDVKILEIEKNLRELMEGNEELIKELQKVWFYFDLIAWLLFV